MDEIKLRTISDINDKIGWAERSLEKLIKNKDDKNELQDNFWSLLSAIQQTKSYFASYLSSKNTELSKTRISKLIIETLEKWEQEKLTDDEKISWYILNKLRNDDSHRNPVKTKNEVRSFYLDTGNGLLMVDNESLLSWDQESLFVLYEKIEYEITFLAVNSICASKKLVLLLENS